MNNDKTIQNHKPLRDNYDNVSEEESENSLEIINESINQSEHLFK